ncbi:acyltransferase [Phycicoccus sp. CSK15P-2]|uniref:acyltransferase family protein n=1 Tax=Phycicoccus sp. CSK15P-2 TaxID=2807627 RepID=UPI00194E4995|nr:acyltransferase family protein [Phycicoccus sp. CSK15P-2]MBM6404601.1 acyltransferase [Phycicoccus sp. CSK15P-2]
MTTLATRPPTAPDRDRTGPSTPSGPPRSHRGRRRRQLPDGVVRGFRPDIEALRALAVVLVVLYHAGLPFLPGGYVGVDVFFVISGYLITRHLHRELIHTGRISLTDFYARRIRRLLPLATLVTLTTVIATWLLASPLQARRTATDALWATLFAMNIHLANTGVDYQANQDPSPLQHYWSLAIEEQFYLAWPLVLAAASLLWLRHRTRPATWALTTTITLLTAASLAHGINQTETARALAYFTTPSRAWELGIGGLLAITAPHLARTRLLRHTPTTTALTIAGLATITTSAVLYADTTTFPGTAALAPTLGTATVIAAGLTHPTPLETHVLDTPVPQGLGRISYGLYLWHWPVLTLTPTYLDTTPTPVQTALAVLLATWLASLTYIGLENPARTAAALRRVGRTLAVGATAVSLGAVVSLGAAALIPEPKGSGAAAATVDPARVVSEVGTAAQMRAVPANLSPALVDVPDDTPSPATGDGVSCMVDLLDTGLARDPSGTCVFGDPAGKTTVVLAGDSHAYQWLPALEAIAVQRHWRLVSLTKSGCPAYDVALVNTILKRDYRECYTWRERVMARIAAERPDHVVLSAFTGSERRDPDFTAAWATGVGTTVSALREGGTTVTVLADTPYPQTDVPDCVAGHLDDARECAVPSEVALSDPERRAATARAAIDAGAAVLDPTPWFCTNDVCPAVVGTTVVYSDNSHMSATWSAALRRLLADRLAETSPALSGD